MVGNLLGFMYAYNLRFGAATTPEQRQAYNQLFIILDRTRDQVLAEAKLTPGASEKADAKAATDFLQDVEKEHRQGERLPRAARDEPSRPAPAEVASGAGRSIPRCRRCRESPRRIMIIASTIVAAGRPVRSISAQSKEPPR